MDILAILLVLAVAAAVVARLAALLFAIPAWFLVIVSALSLLVGVPVPAGVVVLTVALWLASQTCSRIRWGEWRSASLRGLSRVLGAYRATA